MKLLSILILSFVLAGCGMSIEEYNARVKYCKDNCMDFVEYRNINYKPYRIECEAKDGSLFERKLK